MYAYEIATDCQCYGQPLPEYLRREMAPLELEHLMDLLLRGQALGRWLNPRYIAAGHPWVFMMPGECSEVPLAFVWQNQGGGVVVSEVRLAWLEASGDWLAEDGTGSKP